MKGKYTKQSQKKGVFTWKTIVILSILLILLIAIGMMLPTITGERDEPDETGASAETTAPETQEQTETAEIPQPSETVKNSTELITNIQIDTPYVVLHYPARWNGYVTTKVEQQPNRYSVTFVGKIGTHEADLFAIVFGESEEMPIGTLVQEDGTEVAVRLNIDLFSGDDSWTGEELDLAYEMIADSTYVLEELALLENFK